jgi:hypothetical protein
MKKLMTAVGVGALVVLVLIPFLVRFYISHFALWSRGAKPLAIGAAIEEPRRKAIQDIGQLFVDIDRFCTQSGIRYYDTGTTDYCLMGRHNWKTDAIYENRCRYVVTKYYGFPGDFRVAMVQLDSALVASGWVRYAGGIPSLLSGYYDRHYGPDRPKPMNFPHQYLVQNMPDVSYTRGDTFRLMIRAQEEDTTGKAFVLRFEDVMGMPQDLSFQEEHPANTDSLVPAILDTNRYVLVIGILREDYYVN